MPAFERNCRWGPAFGRSGPLFRTGALLIPLEDIYHCTKACSWLTIPVRALQCTFPLVWGSGGRVQWPFMF